MQVFSQQIEHQKNCISGLDCSKSNCSSSCVKCLNEKFCTQCKYGYFIYQPTKDRSTQLCVQCPLASSNQTPNNFYCAECVTNPYHWQNYHYEIQNQLHLFRQNDFRCNQVITPNDNGVMIAKPNPHQYLFYLVEKSNNQVEVISQQNCQQISMNNMQICAVCIEGYIFDQRLGLCIKCSDQIQNCLQCEYQSNVLVCLSCFDSYYLNQKSSTNLQEQCLLCSKIYDGCKKCDKNGCIYCQDGYVEQINQQNGQVNCIQQLQCIASDKQITNIDQNQCILCHNSFNQNCKICQIEFSTNKYSCINYCDQYKQYYDQISNSCKSCSQNCLQCDQNGCSQCEQNYQINSNNECVLKCGKQIESLQIINNFIKKDLENCSQCQEVQVYTTMKNQIECSACLNQNLVFSFNMQKCLSCGAGCSLCSDNGIKNSIKQFLDRILQFNANKSQKFFGEKQCPKKKNLNEKN